MSKLRIGYDAVYGAWARFRKGKQSSLAIELFAYNLEANLYTTANQLTNKTYRHGGYQQVVLQEKKRRDLAVAPVRDRVVHRLLYEYLVERYDQSFDPDVWSCRVDKGLHKCLARTQRILRKYPRSYVWRADITKFFDSVRHSILMDCLRRKIAHDKQAMWLCQEVILS